AGNLYIGWTRWTLIDSQLLFVRSTDHGRTWSKPVEIDNIRGLPRDDNGAIEGFAGAVGPDSTLYAAWTDGSHGVFTTSHDGDVDVFCSRSADYGETWSPAVRVNNDSAHDGADQFFQWMTVDPRDGAVYVVFYDRRGDPKNRQQTVTLARSSDGGRTYQNFAWMDQPFDAQGVFMGDYNGIAALNGRVYGVWTQKPENKTSRDKVIQIGVADF